MYRLVFENEQMIQLDSVKDMKVYLARWDGKNQPKYMMILIKEKAVDKSQRQLWENLFYYQKLRTIFVYDEEGQKLSHAIPAPSNFIDLHYEEGDLVVQFGDSLYADEV